MHAAAGRFRRGRAKSDQATQKHEAGGRQETTDQETTDHDGLLHDFVLVPVGVAIPKAGSTDPVTSRPARPVIFGIEPVPMALSPGTAPFHPAASPTKC